MFKKKENLRATEILKGHKEKKIGSGEAGMRYNLAIFEPGREDSWR